VQAVTLTDRAAARPPGFDLAQAWREAVAPLELRRQLAEIGAQLVEAYTKQS
jgi:ABC-type amino acid transport system permease subunit